ncbi:MAG: hypothetical protein WA666_09360 [Nitrospirota bacterium]
MNMNALEDMLSLLQPDFNKLASLQKEIRENLIQYADGKPLKGNELVGWLGEIYVKSLLDGKLVNDQNEHDVETNNQRISVKARKGNGSGWQQTSAIPKYEGEDCPTQLAFVHLLDDYSLDRIWLFDWQHLCQNNRFISHIVRGNHRSYIFKLNENRDREFIIYQRPHLRIS